MPSRLTSLSGMGGKDAAIALDHAAETLNMSRHHLLAFMDRGDVPFHYDGAVRTVKIGDLQGFAKVRAAGQEIVHDALHSDPSELEVAPLSQDEFVELRNL